MSDKKRRDKSKPLEALATAKTVEDTTTHATTFLRACCCMPEVKNRHTAHKKWCFRHRVSYATNHRDQVPNSLQQQLIASAMAFNANERATSRHRVPATFVVAGARRLHGVLKRAALPSLEEGVSPGILRECIAWEKDGGGEGVRDAVMALGAVDTGTDAAWPMPLQALCHAPAFVALLIRYGRAGEHATPRELSRCWLLAAGLLLVWRLFGEVDDAALNERTRWPLLRLVTAITASLREHFEVVDSAANGADSA